MIFLTIKIIIHQNKYWSENIETKLHHTGIVANNLNTSITSDYYYKYQNDIPLARGCSIYNTVLVVFVCVLDFYFTTMASVDDAKTEGDKRTIVIAMDGSVHAKYALTCKYSI